MRVDATLKSLRIAPRKVRLVTHSIVGLPVAVALVELRRQVKRSSKPIMVLLESAIANATNNFKLAKETLYVKEVQVMEGVRLKRFTPKAFGQATPLLRRSSKIRIILDERAVKVKPPVVEKKKVTKKTAPATKKETKPESTKKTSTAA